MEKEAYSISQAAEMLQCEKYLLRFYESEFELPIPRTSSNRRYYTEKEMDMFHTITRLKKEGYANKEIKAYFHQGTIEMFQPDDNMEVESEDSEVCLKEVHESNTAIGNGTNLDEVFSIIKMLKEEVESLKSLNDFKQRDELITENARLKMKLKEKTYELMDVKEKLNAFSKKKVKKRF